MAIVTYIHMYHQLFQWLKENSHEAYEAVLGNVSAKEWEERKILTICNLGAETNFEYRENVHNESLLIDMFDGIRFDTHYSESFEDRKKICIYQTLFILIMSDNYDSDQQIVISVENQRNYLSYRIFYRSELEGGILEKEPDPSTALELPKIKELVLA